ncbi:hypothetical protein [Actinophytocola sp.]|nr:hypothetical protein [Actinophytocola sp.]HYQ69872.1 hypothetical protein [Actinophytocola sp.]
MRLSPPWSGHAFTRHARTGVVMVAATPHRPNLGRTLLDLDG